jgi:hypothetical protein
MSSHVGSHGLGVSPNPGIEQRASERATDPIVDPETHNLHAGVGERCLICDHVIQRDQPVRRTVSGSYVHDICHTVGPPPTPALAI